MCLCGSAGQDVPAPPRTPRRTFGKRVGGNPSRVRISYPPPLLSPGNTSKGLTASGGALRRSQSQRDSWCWCRGCEWLGLVVGREAAGGVPGRGIGFRLRSSGDSSGDDKAAPMFGQGDTVKDAQGSRVTVGALSCTASGVGRPPCAEISNTACLSGQSTGYEAVEAGGWGGRKKPLACAGDAGWLCPADRRSRCGDLASVDRRVLVGVLSVRRGPGHVLGRLRLGGAGQRAQACGPMKFNRRRTNSA